MFLDGVLFDYKTLVPKSTGVIPFEWMFCWYVDFMGVSNKFKHISQLRMNYILKGRVAMLI